MKWDKVKLGDLFQIKHGWAFKGEYFSSQGEYIVVTPGNFFEQGGFKQTPGKEKFYTGDYPEDYLLKKNNIIIAMTEQGPGLLGSPGIVPSDNKYLHNQRIGLITNVDLNRIIPMFIYRLFYLPAIRNEIFATSTGSKVKHTAPKRIYNIEFHIPPLSIQHKIVSILSTYDELIGNNLSRIKLLEEKAFLSYKRIVRSGSLKRRKLIDVLDLKYGKALKSDNRTAGKYSVYGSSGEVGSHEAFLVKGPGIIIGRKGNVGSVFWSFDNFWVIDTAYYVESEISLYFLYFNMKEQHFVNTDAAVPGLNRNIALDNSILLPPVNAITGFQNEVKPVFQLINNLHQQNTKLREARDILLPQLMNGQIEV